MDDQWKDLAEQFRVTAHSGNTAEVLSQDEQAARLAEARRAQNLLIDDLEAFGAALGVVQVVREGDEITWAFDGRRVFFTPKGAAEVEVSFRELTSRSGRLYREALLDDRWVMSVTHRGQEDRTPLFDAGLTRLLVQGLRLKSPGEHPERSEQDASPSPVATVGSDEGSSASEASRGPKRTL